MPKVSQLLAPTFVLSFLAPQVVADVSPWSSAPVLSPVRTPLAPSTAQAPAAAVAMSPSLAPPAEVAPVAAPAEALGMFLQGLPDFLTYAAQHAKHFPKDWFDNNFQGNNRFFLASNRSILQVLHGFFHFPLLRDVDFPSNSGQ